MAMADQTVPNRTAEASKIISQESEYAEVAHPPRLIVKSEDDTAVASFESAGLRPTDQTKGREGSSAMVTGTFRSPMNRKKPVPPPKPGKFLKVDSKDPILPTPSPCTEESKAEAEDDEGNYTGGTGGTGGTTTGTTGDSGFSDAREFLKVDLPTDLPAGNQEVPGYYKSLRREDVGTPTYYKLADREKTQLWHGK